MCIFPGGHGRTGWRSAAHTTDRSATRRQTLPRRAAVWTDGPPGRLHPNPTLGPYPRQSGSRGHDFYSTHWLVNSSEYIDELIFFLPSSVCESGLIECNDPSTDGLIESVIENWWMDGLIDWMNEWIACHQSLILFSRFTTQPCPPATVKSSISPTERVCRARWSDYIRKRACTWYDNGRE